MIELTKEQARHVADPAEDLSLFMDPTTREVYVLVPKIEYDRVQEILYDDSPWTDREMDALAVEVDAMLDDDMAIEDETS